MLEDRLAPHIVKYRVNDDKAFLVVLSDLHQGLNDRKTLQRTVQFILTVPNCYVILGGDATNTITRGSKGDITEEWASGTEQLYTLVEDLKPLVDNNRLLAVCGNGNHPRRVQDETFISIEMMLATMLGDRSLYKGSMCLIYFNVNKNCYVGAVVHKGSKRDDFFEYMRYDFLIREHFHLYKTIPKLVIDHNKFTKKPIVKVAYDIWNGSYQIMPEYCKMAGYRPQLFGTHFIEMDGKEHTMKVWTDNDFYDIMNR